MQQRLLLIFYGLCALAASAPVWFSCLWVFWDGRVRPSLISRAEIARCAEEARLVDPLDPARAAFNRELHAWFKGDDFEQGKWRRVRARLKRLNDAGNPSSRRAVPRTTRTRE